MQKQRSLVLAPYIDLLFNVEYTLSLTRAGLMQHYTLVFNSAQIISIDLDAELRYLLGKYIEYVRSQRQFFIDSFFYLPWNLICSLLPWERIQELQPLFCSDTQALQRYRIREQRFRIRLNLLLLPLARRYMEWAVLVKRVVSPMGLTLPAGTQWRDVKTLYQVFQIIENTVNI